MRVIRWAIFVAIMIIVSSACKLNLHQRHFNLFILGLCLLSTLVIVVFWLISRNQRA